MLVPFKNMVFLENAKTTIRLGFVLKAMKQKKFITRIAYILATFIFFWIKQMQKVFLQLF